MARPGPRFFIVDVFAEKKYSGNQLAVVIPEKAMTSRHMQEIAAEFNFPETTFVYKPLKSNLDWRVRIFTPKQEIPFAGHPTLGSAYIIRKHLDISAGKRSVTHKATQRPATGGMANRNPFQLDLKAGKIPVWLEEKSDWVWMKQNKPTFGPAHPPESIAEILCTSESNLHPEFLSGETKLQEVSTGISFLMVPMKNLESVSNAYLDKAAYSRYFFSRQPLPIYVFAAEALSRKNHIHARMFAPNFGISEDPATGSAAGCLGAYLARYGLHQGGIPNITLGSNPLLDLRIEQGYAVNRPSLLRLKVTAPIGANSEVLGDILVGGRVFEIASGFLT